MPSCLIPLLVLLQAKKKSEAKLLEDYLNDVVENPVHKLEVIHSLEIMC